MAPTISPFTLMGNPPPHAATRESVGIPAKSDGSSLIKLKKSCVETPNRAVYAFFCAISMVGIEAPSILLKALRLPPSSRIATFSLTPSSLAFATAASTIFCASSEEMLYFFTTLAIGLTPHLICFARWSGALKASSKYGTSRVQKQSRVFNEELWVLVVRAVIGVGVDDQLRIRHVLLHDEREDRGYVHVVTAVHDEGWLLDSLQIVGGPLLLDAPLADRFDLGGRHLVVHFGIAALLPKMRALQERPSRRLARRGRTEFDPEPDTLGRIVGVRTKEPPCSLGYQLHSRAAARTCAIDDQPANEIGRLHSDFLHDHAANREAKQVNLLQAQRPDEGDGVSAHLLERGRDLAGAVGDAGVVEQARLPVASQAIRHRRVPVVHGAQVVLVEDDGDAVGFAKAAIGKADSVSFEELRRRGLVAVLVHHNSPDIKQEDDRTIFGTFASPSVHRLQPTRTCRTVLDRFGLLCQLLLRIVLVDSAEAMPISGEVRSGSL